MKETTRGGGALQGLKGKQVSVTLIALICTTILVWGWERTPIASIFPVEDHVPVRRLVQPENRPENRLEMTYSGPPMVTPSATKKSPFMPAEESISFSAEELPVQKLPSISAEESPAEKLSSITARESHSEKTPSGSMEELRDEKSPSSLAEGWWDESRSISVKESLVEKSQSSSSKESVVGKLLSRSADKSQTGLAENMPSTRVTESVALEKKACDYTEGKWVKDNRRPVYSGKACKRWLSEMWACRLTQRTDFSYEKFRWQPDNCDMPDFEGQQFLTRMQNKTLALVGDSLGRQQFQSIMCLITGGRDSPDIEDVGRKYGLIRARGSIRPDGWAFRFPKTNTTILYYWSASLCEIEPLNWNDPSTDFAMHLDRPARFLRDNLHRFDVLVLNTGHHWNRGKLNANRWRMYVNGQPNNERKIRDMKSAQNFTVHCVVKWLDGQLDKYPKLRAFMRTISPRHFFNGDWDSGGQCDNTRPFSGINKLIQKPANDPVAESAVKGTRVELLDITGISQLRDEAHISKYSIKAKNGAQDCLHWCLPGVPDTWNELLFAQLVSPQHKNGSAVI
eukprot:Gb_26279 [translate_table: standard]